MLILSSSSFNKLAELPEDFFSNMPKLSDVHLEKNNFMTLTEMPFSVAFRAVHLFSITGKKNLFSFIVRIVSLIFLTIRSFFSLPKENIYTKLPS